MKMTSTLVVLLLLLTTPPPAATSIGHHSGTCGRNHNSPDIEDKVSLMQTGPGRLQQREDPGSASGGNAAASGAMPAGGVNGAIASAVKTVNTNIGTGTKAVNDAVDKNTKTFNGAVTKGSTAVNDALVKGSKAIKDNMAAFNKALNEFMNGGAAGGTPAALVQGTVSGGKWRHSMAKSKEEYAAAFAPAESSEQADWVGTYVDIFSPDDTNPDSRRFIDLDESSGELQVSADTGGEKWGRRFDQTTSVNPILVSTDASNERKTSFLSKVPKDAPVYLEAVAGALDFTLIMGTAFGEKVVKWNGLYDGKGGKFGGEDVPASDCDNFWRGV